MKTQMIYDTESSEGTNQPDSHEGKQVESRKSPTRIPLFASIHDKDILGIPVSGLGLNKRLPWWRKVWKRLSAKIYQ